MNNAYATGVSHRDPFGSYARIARERIGSHVFHATRFHLSRFTGCYAGCFIDFQRQPIGIGKKREAAAREFVHSNWFCINPLCIERGDGCVEVRRGKGKVPQPRSLWPRRAGRGIGKGKQFNHILPVQGQVQLPGLAFGPVRFPDNLQPQHLDIKVFGSRIVCADKRNMMNV